MNEKKSHKPLNLEEIRKILDEIKEKGNLLGILMAYRDGIVIAENINVDCICDEFGAMCASVFGSAIGVGKTIGEDNIDKIVAELNDQTMIIVGCDERTFLVLLTDNNSKVNLILSELKNYLDRIVKFF